MPEDEFSAEEPGLIAERDRSARAKALYESEMFQEALVGMRSNYERALIDAAVDDLDGITGIKVLLKQLDTFDAHFLQIMQTGKLAVKRLEIIEGSRNAKGDERPWFDRDLSVGEKV